MACGAFLPKGSVTFDSEGRGGVAKGKEAFGPRVCRSGRLGVKDPSGAAPSEVLAHMIRGQEKNRFYSVKPHHVECRPKAVKWMASFASKFRYQPQTLMLSINYFDAVLSQFTVTYAQVKLIAFICLHLAAKMCERDEKIPHIEEAYKLFDQEFSPSEVLNCEKLVFGILNYRLDLSTPISFVLFFLSKGVVLQSELCSEKLSHDSMESFMLRFEKLAVNIALSSIQDYEFYQFTSLAIACSAIALARKITRIGPVWSEELEELTFLDPSSIQACMTMLEKEPELSSLVQNGISLDKIKSQEAANTRGGSPSQDGGLQFARPSQMDVEEERK